MRKEIRSIFQIAAVFIGTIVGAGLASGREICQFFTQYGYKSFIGIVFTGVFYIAMCTIISKISIRYQLNSYSEVFNIVSPNLLGKATGVITTLYLISSSSIILAGSGALVNQFFGLPKIVGTLIMMFLAILILLRETEGLIEINSIIVPSLLIVIFTLILLYLIFSRDSMSISSIKSFGASKNNWWLSTLLYSGYNILCCCGVLVPLSNETKNSKTMIRGIVLGATMLTILCICINLMLMVNQPYIFKYEIPLLYVADRFGKGIQVMLLAIIWLEMFSTEVSDVYSICKTLNIAFRIKFRNAIFLVLCFALPISQIGFSNLISTLYPIFGLLSLVFIVQCIHFYFKKMT